MPMRKSRRFSGGRPMLRSTMPICTSIAQRTASDPAAELDDRAVAGALGDATVMERGGWVNEVAAKRPQARKGPILVGAGEPAVPDDIRNQDRRELSGLAHCAPPAGQS